MSANGAFANAPRLSQEDCTALVQLAIGAERIGLPTTGAQITSAEWQETRDHGSFCKVLGIISPVDPEAFEIRWEANLPEYWNEKMLQYGGGGYNGIIPEIRKTPTLGLPSLPSPLAQGYVTFGDDSGHERINANDASFARNDEALQNYAWMHIKKALDVVRVTAQSAYGTPVQRVYFQGGSTGGREGLTAAMRWPTDYDGVLSNYPTAWFMGLRLWGAALTQAIYPDGSAGWIPPELVAEIQTRSIARCDALDGIEDGLVSNIAECRAGAAQFIEDMRCSDGATETEACLTDEQIDRTIKVYHEGYTLPYALANGMTEYLGYNALEGVAMALGSQPDYAEPVQSGPHAHHAARAYEFFTYFVNQDGALDFGSFDIQNPGSYSDRLVALSEMIDATNPDLSAFADHGGKLILVHGTEDPSVSPLGVAKLYDAIVSEMGEDRTRAFMRFYLVPGLAHGSGSGTYGPAWNNLAALDAWVESGIPPAGEVAAATTEAMRGRTLPMCDYPAWPQYRGEGEVADAESYACVTD
ncbi:tannase/feruloyl esterase family alpha/beta hydrolase [Ponticoccus alexandrii]|uniref:Tannase/feruloyl esterase family alpha/beta hydrolase n=1 Tax=Ponticoccus alexandrii TaxID=1943633 RepID=A0ABX7FF06_9RHOB|nr:tannase/feruloyl esterase family alpha/beta hydrolase [Ponticoccus alexandrii]QRF68953.1 tannase/feruloyl esterase family alpha/beta hydrolase [Ponticoccus alexandrii]